MQCTVDSTVLSAQEWKVVGWGWRYISGASAVHLPRLIFPKMQWNAPHNPPSLSDALCSISLVHPLSPLPCSSWLRRLDPWSMIYSTIYALSLQHKTLFNCIINFTSTALSCPYCQVFRHRVCLQSGWLRIIWKWERGLWDRFEIDQNWSDRDWSRLIRLLDRREAKNRQWICENWGENWKE